MVGSSGTVKSPFFLWHGNLEMLLATSLSSSSLHIRHLAPGQLLSPPLSPSLPPHPRSCSLLFTTALGSLPKACLPVCRLVTLPHTSYPGHGDLGNLLAVKGRVQDEMGCVCSAGMIYLKNPLPSPSPLSPLPNPQL